MSLKDRLNDALIDTPEDNARRRETLKAVLAAAAGDGDPDVQAAIARIISEREQKAASYSVAGQSELARSERAEIDALREYLRIPVAEAPAVPRKSGPAPAATPFLPSRPLISRMQMIVGGIAVVALAIIVYLLVRPSGTGVEAVTAPGGGTQVALSRDDHTLGDPKAPITMLEYAAPTCPHCAHFALNVMPLIKQQYIDTGKVFYIFRVFPLQASDFAVEAMGRSLPADKYFQFLDLMFRNQTKWDPEYQVSDVHAALIQLGRVAGMTPSQVDQAISDRAQQDRINQVAQDGEQRYNIQGTPTFVINGTVVQAQDGTWPALKARFDSLLSKKQ